MSQFHHPGKDLISTDEWDKIVRELGLTMREAEVAKLLMVGQTRSRIAKTLNCSVSTVRVYIDKLFEKLMVQDKVGIVLRLVRIWLDIRENR